MPWRYRPRMPMTGRPLAGVPALAPVAGPTQAQVVALTGDAQRRRRRGRPTLLNSTQQALLLAAVKAGCRLPVAARLAGVSPKTVNEWVRRGRGHDGRPAIEPYVGFIRAVEQAEAEAEVAAMAAIRKAMPGDWRAAAWFLERTHPEWRRRKDRGDIPAADIAQARVTMGTIVVSRKTLERIGSEPRSVQPAEPDLDGPAPVRQARQAAGP